MKKLIFVIILFQFKLVIGQNIVKFDSIVFYYNYSTYASKKNKSETETTKINRVDNSYYISNKKIDSTLINNLWIELNTKKDNFTYDYFLLKKLKIKKYKIKKSINFYSQIIHSQNKKISQDLKNKLIVDISNLKDFSEFIEFEKPKKESIYSSLDGSKSILICFYYEGEKTFFKFEDYHRCGQPFYIGEKLIKNKLVNLDVNQVILDILPSKSKFGKEFNYQNVMDKYIDWYILRAIEKNFPTE